MKRAFIPLSHRPDVRGASLASEESPRHSQVSALERRQILAQLASGAIHLPDVDGEWAKALVKGLFPSLAPKSKTSEVTTNTVIVSPDNLNHKNSL